MIELIYLKMKEMQLEDNQILLQKSIYNSDE